MGLSVPECLTRSFVPRPSPGVCSSSGTSPRYALVVREAQALIARGDIGRLKMVRADLLRGPLGMAAWRLDPAAYGGVMMDIGIHYLDLLCFLMGAAPARVSGAGADATGAGYLNQCQLLLEFADGGVGAFGMCLYSPFGRRDHDLGPWDPGPDRGVRPGRADHALRLSQCKERRSCPARAGGSQGLRLPRARMKCTGRSSRACGRARAWRPMERSAGRPSR